MGKGGLGGRRTKPRARSPYPTNEPEPNDARHIEVGGSGTLTLFDNGQQFTGGFLEEFLRHPGVEPKVPLDAFLGAMQTCNQPPLVIGWRSLTWAPRGIRTTAVGPSLALCSATQFHRIAIKWAYDVGRCSRSLSVNHPETSRRVKALWSLLIGIIFASEVAWILFLVYLPIALVR